MVPNVRRNHKAYQGRGGGYGEKEGEKGGGDYIPICHHQNDSCIKAGSDESRFDVSLIVKDKVSGQCPQTTTFEVKGEPKRI